MASTPYLFNLDSLPPGKMSLPRVVGGSVEGGASLSGISTASDATGGGFVAVEYQAIDLGNTVQSRMRLMNQLAVALSGGIRLINVQLMTDFIAPTRIGASPNGDGAPVPFSDTSIFSDGSSWKTGDLLSGSVVGAQALGAATITVSVIGGTGVLTGGEWFGLVHSTKGNRAYCVIAIDSVTVDTFGNNIYTVGIRPPLREAIADGAPVTWWRPLCLMRLAPGPSISIDVSKYWMATPSISLIEAF